MRKQTTLKPFEKPEANKTRNDDNRKRNKKEILFLSALLLLLFATFLFASCEKNTLNSSDGLSHFAGDTEETISIDLNKYVKISVEGYNSAGTATCEFDEEAIKNDYVGKIKLKSQDSELRSKNEENYILDILKYINVYLDKSTDLNNGDLIKLEWYCDNSYIEKNYNCVLNYTETQYTVTELKELDTFDPFDYVNVSFNGISPNGNLVLTPDYNKSEMQYIIFDADKKFGLKPGDTIVVTASVSCTAQEFINKFKCRLGNVEKEYTVPDLDKYVDNQGQLSKEIIQKMSNQLKDNFFAVVANRWEENEKIIDFHLDRTYLLKLKDHANETPHNYLYFIYEVTYKNENKITYTDGSSGNFVYYWYGYYSDIVISANGECIVDLNNYSVSEADDDPFTEAQGTGDYLYIGDYTDENEEKHGYYAAGFKDIETLEKKYIISKIESYEYEMKLY